jgi:hypothetical protein
MLLGVKGVPSSILDGPAAKSFLALCTAARAGLAPPPAAAQCSVMVNLLSEIVPPEAAGEAGLGASAEAADSLLREAGVFPYLVQSLVEGGPLALCAMRLLECLLLFAPSHSAVDQTDLLELFDAVEGVLKSHDALLILVTDRCLQVLATASPQLVARCLATNPDLLRSYLHSCSSSRAPASSKATLAALLKGCFSTAGGLAALGTLDELIRAAHLTDPTFLRSVGKGYAKMLLVAGKGKAPSLGTRLSNGRE